jgi:transaldolase
LGASWGAWWSYRIDSNQSQILSQRKTHHQSGHAFRGLAPNLQVKIPVTQAGMEAIEEATYADKKIDCHSSPH